jgi:hypothetical protein
MGSGLLNFKQGGLSIIEFLQSRNGSISYFQLLVSSKNFLFYIK